MHLFLKWNKVDAIARAKGVQKDFRIAFDGRRASRNAYQEVPLGEMNQYKQR